MLSPCVGGFIKRSRLTSDQQLCYMYESSDYRDLYIFGDTASFIVSGKVHVYILGISVVYLLVMRLLCT